MSTGNPNFESPDNKNKPEEKKWLTDEEVRLLLESLEKKTEGMTLPEIPKEAENLKADDDFPRDQLEFISEFYRIDFEKLRKMSADQVITLASHLPAEKLEEMQTPLTFEQQQDLDDFEMEIKKAGGMINWLKQKGEEKKEKPFKGIVLPNDDRLP